MLHSSSCKVLKNFASGSLLLFPLAAFAEVSDKEPSLSSVWITGCVVALICFIVAYFVRWYSIIVAVFPLCWFILHFIELHSEDVGVALYAEQGIGYFIQSYLAALLILLGVILGVTFSNRQRQKHPKTTRRI
jgi:phosphotransferase system  glucose/maltose/N-acetylglucosamine-specific IIC component